MAVQIKWNCIELNHQIPNRIYTRTSPSQDPRAAGAPPSIHALTVNGDCLARRSECLRACVCVCTTIKESLCGCSGGETVSADERDIERASDTEIIINKHTVRRRVWVQTKRLGWLVVVERTGALTLEKFPCLDAWEWEDRS